MRKLSLHHVALVAVCILIAVTVYMGLPRASRLSADSSPGIHIGVYPPPTEREDHPWANPDRAAVWIGGHSEWSVDHYIWLSGYYAYPQIESDRWVSRRYSHGQDGYSYHPGHWSKSVGTPSPKGIESDSGTYIHPVLQDNGVGNGSKEIKDGLNRPQQQDYHESQAN